MMSSTLKRQFLPAAAFKLPRCAPATSVSDLGEPISKKESDR